MTNDQEEQMQPEPQLNESRATQAAEQQDPQRHRRPRTGPIIWGAIFLAFCVYVTQSTLSPGKVDSVTWLITAMIGVGVLLLAVGAAVLIRNARSS